MSRRSAGLALATATALVAGLALAAPAQATARDTDGDGMPNWWERKYGLDWRKANSGGDPDRGGVSNLR